MVRWKVLRHRWVNCVGLGVWLKRLEGVHPWGRKRFGVVWVVVVGGVAVVGGVVGAAGVQWVAIIWMRRFGSGFPRQRWMSSSVWRGLGMVVVAVSVAILGSVVRIFVVGRITWMAAGLDRCVSM